MATAIAGIVLAPVGGWMVLALTQQAPTAGRFNESAQSRLLNTYVTRDVASAESVLVPPTALKDCTPAGGAGSTTVMNLVFLDSEQQIVVYQVHDNEFGDPSLFRRTCEFTSTRTLIEETEVLRDVGSVAASCPTAVGSACKEVKVSAQLTSGTEIDVRATVRASLGKLAGNGGTFRPEAVIRITDRKERSETDGLRVTLSASESVDLDSSLLTFTWAADGQSDQSGPTAYFEWTAVGTYRVTLTVEDDQGNISTASDTVRLVNQPPLITSASASVDGSDPVGEVGTSQFDFSATASDPDSSDTLEYSWTLNGVSLDPGIAADLSLVFPVGTATGSTKVLLIVTDDDGGQSTQSVPITLNPVGGGTTTTSSSTSTTVASDLPTAAFIAQVAPGAAPPGVQVSFDNTSTGTGVLNHAWNFGFPGYVSTAAEPQFLYTNPGSYIVSLTVTDNQGSDTAVQAVAIPGTPAAPASPGWSGNNVTWPAVPGAARYRVVVTNYGTNPDSTTCLASGVSATVAADQTLSVSAGTNTCPNPQSSATLSVEANGNWGLASSPSVKP